MNEPIFSILTGKVSANLWSCQNNSCIESAGNLCNLSLLNECPYENYNSCNNTMFSSLTGQNETGAPPAALVCCSDLGFAWGFSQAFLNEQTWDSYWCANYDQQTCGTMSVNDYNRCQYLMFVYGPTEAGDYCDRIDLYTNNAYNVLNLPSSCL